MSDRLTAAIDRIDAANAEDRATSVFAKPVAKMSPEGRAAALALDLGPEIGATLATAVEAVRAADSDTP